MTLTPTARTLVSDTRRPEPPAHRRWPYLAAIGVLLVVIVLLLLRPWAHDRATPRTAAPSVVPSGPAVSSQPRAPAADTSYVDFHGVRLPVSKAHGPFRTDGELVSGFTRDAPGAALAAAHYGTRVSAPLGPRVYEPTIRRYGLGGSPAVLDALHRQYEQARAAEPGVPDGQPLTSRQNAQALGYRIPAYRPSGPVAVHLLMSGDGPTGAVLVDPPVTVEWVDGTWKVQVPPDGNFPGGPAQSTAGFTRF